MKNFKMTRFLKGLTLLAVGFIFPILSPVGSDETRYRCTTKGVKDLDTDTVESWRDVRADFFEWCGIKEVTIVE